MSDILDIMNLSPVIPVVTMPQDGDPLALGEALQQGGIGVIEVTLRSAAGLSAIRALSAANTGLCVGAGTVWTTEQAHAVIDAGAQFVVSPGISMPVFDVCQKAGVPILPGAQTTSEVAHWVAQGLNAVKFFPASVAGGIGALKAFSAVFDDLKYCPTGGVNMDNAGDYLSLETIPCVGGTWLVPSSDVEAGNWSQIHERAKAAAAL